MYEEFDNDLGSVWWLLFTQLREYLVNPLRKWEPHKFIESATNTQLLQGQILRDNMVNPLYDTEEHQLFYGFLAHLAWLMESGAQFGTPCPTLRHCLIASEQYLPLYRKLMDGEMEPFVLNWYHSSALQLLSREWKLAFGIPSDWIYLPVSDTFIRQVLVLQEEEYLAPAYIPINVRKDTQIRNFLRGIFRSVARTGHWTYRSGHFLGDDLYAVAHSQGYTGETMVEACREFAQAWEGPESELPLLAQSPYSLVRAVAKTRLGG